ncbi:MAG: polysaccharide lyase [Verrucomicrobiae bacterium]|nr:polysaccharide lyase [Verrucomicrobiae bacterium]
MPKSILPNLAALSIGLSLGPSVSQAANPDPDAVSDSLKKAVAFYHEKAATHGGYVYRYSADLSLREAEGIPDVDTIWIQPPGTPAVGEAFLDAWEATGDPASSQAALAAAEALVRTQLQSGGWYYHGHFDPEARQKFFYRRSLTDELIPDPTPESDRTGKSGWFLWKQGKYRERNTTVFDDDVTQSALRFLMRVDAALKFKHEAIHDAVVHGLDAMVRAQYPNGGWSANFDRYPGTSPSTENFTIIKANYPETWSRTWPKAYDGPYVTNDSLMSNAVSTLIRAVEIYGDQEPRYRETLLRAGDFLILAQMPDPQPAWAQHYTEAMQPTWDRAFEPPAISGHESQGILEALIDIARVTGEERFLEPVPKAVAYLRKSQLPNGRLSRFYELETNRPLYFTRGDKGKGWAITYETDRLASNYGWEWDSRLDAIESAWRLAKSGAENPEPSATEQVELAAAVAAIIESQDSRGAWAVPGQIRNAEGKKTDPDGGVIESATFIANVKSLARYLSTNRKP